MYYMYTLVSTILSEVLLVLCREVEIISSFGRIKGLRLPVEGTDRVVYHFRKIPYAVPPVGHLRFKEPVPHPSLTGLYDGTEYGPSCMQTIPRHTEPFRLPNQNVSEDCLHLNIYVPNHIGPTLRAVMVWIHGGNFNEGQGTLYDGSILASTGNVIVITINYRLGLLGFLSTEDKCLSGNYGLFDQLEAIRWIKRHIGSIGGDPNKITLFGQSAGALSASLLTVSPLSKDLFQRVILESGGDLQNRVVDRNIRMLSLWAVQQLGCINNIITNVQITNDTVRCMQNVNAEDIVIVGDNMFSSPVEIIPVFNHLPGPSVDGKLLPGAPEDLLRNASFLSSEVFKSLDIMLGYTSAEGGTILPLLRAIDGALNSTLEDGVPSEVFCRALVPSITDQFFDGNERVKEAMCRAYSSAGDNKEQGRFTVNWFGDAIYGYPTQQLIDLQLKYSSKSLYQYIFSEEQSHRQNSVPSWFKGANHKDELPFIFGIQGIVPRYTSTESRLSYIMMKYWTTFAKTGSPNGRDSGPHWPPYIPRRACLELNDNITIIHDLFSDRLALWLKTIPDILAA